MIFFLILNAITMCFVTVRTYYNAFYQLNAAPEWLGSFFFLIFVYAGLTCYFWAFIYALVAFKFVYTLRKSSASTNNDAKKTRMLKVMICNMIGSLFCMIGWAYVTMDAVAPPKYWVFAPNGVFFGVQIPALFAQGVSVFQVSIIL